jgi:hypothetical protein
MSVFTLLLIFFVLASLPWMTERPFLLLPIKKAKSILIRIIELLVYYLVALLVSIAFEMQFAGDVYSQQWEFFVTTFCLFLVLATPGVIYRYQWLPMQQKYR